MVKRVLPPLVPAASRMLGDPPWCNYPAPDAANATTLHWETAGHQARLVATLAGPANPVVDLGCYSTRVRAQVRGILHSRCRAGLRAAAGTLRPWTYHGGGVPLRPLSAQPGLLCFLQADGWVSLIAESWPGREAPGPALGRYSVWEVIHWLSSPPAPPPVDEDTPLDLPAPMEPEIRAVLAWWLAQAQAPESGLTGGVALSAPQQAAFVQALATELQAHLAYTGWDAELPAWRETERALGLQDDPDPVLIRAASRAGLWTTLLPGWSKERPTLHLWLNPGQVLVAQGPATPQIIWPVTPAGETLTDDQC